MKIAVVGSINMDMTVTVEKIPHKGETLPGQELYYIPGGKGANQAVAMAKLGADVEMFGCVGDDSNGTLLIENLKAQGVKTGQIRVMEGTPTGVAFVTVGENDNTIVIVAGANNRVDCAYIDSIKNELKKSDMVVLQLEIPMETVEYVIDFCFHNGIQVILNPAPACPLKQNIIEKISYLTPNEHEARILFGDCKREDLLRRYPEKLFITLGSKGVSTCLKSGEILTIPARPAKVRDTTGAGDTLNGAFCVRIAEGAAIVNALQFANVAASLSTEKLGAQAGMPMREEVVEALVIKTP